MPGYYCKLEFYNKICIFNLTKSVFHAWLHPIYVKTFLMGRNLFDQLILSASVNVKSNNIVHWQVNGSMGRDFVEKKCLVTILQALTWWSLCFQLPKTLRWSYWIGCWVKKWQRQLTFSYQAGSSISDFGFITHLFIYFGSVGLIQLYQRCTY